jgi:4-amino-4-deoxy-L-arabinose transferase-like glycosyltransferase
MATPRRLQIAVLAGAAALYLTRLGAVDCWAPDEPRYAQIADEVRSFEHGARGLVLLHLAGEPYTQKPPLYFWLAALAGAPVGRVGETAARLPSALAGLASVALLMRFGTSLRGEVVGAASAALLATSVGFAYLARRVQLDVLLAAFELLALVAFWRLDRAATRRPRDVALLHGALGLAVLTKGPVGLLLPSLAILAWLAWERRLAALRRCVPAWAPLLSVGPGLVWISGAVALAPSGFAQQAIVENLWGRFAQGTAHAAPVYYYLIQLPLDFLPWSLLAPLVALEARRVFAADGEPERARLWRFLLAWIGSALVFFSISTGKRGLYLLPVQPALALLCADATLARLARGARPGGWLPALLAAAAAVLAALGLALPALAARFGVDVPAASAASLSALAAVATLAFRAAGPAWPRRAAVVVAGVAAAELVFFTQILPALDAEKSARPIAAAADALTRPGEPVGVTRGTLVGALAYYGHRPVKRVESDPQLAEFLAGGGRVVVAQAAHVERLARSASVEVLHRARRGSRALVVARLAPRSAEAFAP